MKSRKMRKAVFAALSTAKRNAHQTLVEICEVRRILGKSRHRCESDIKMDAKELRR